MIIPKYIITFRENNKYTYQYLSKVGWVDLCDGNYICCFLIRKNLASIDRATSTTHSLNL